MRYSYVALLLLLQSSCSSVDPTTIYVPQDVEIPVSVKCGTGDLRLKSLPFDTISHDATLYEKIQALLENDANSHYNIEQLKKVIDTCSN